MKVRVSSYEMVKQIRKPKCRASFTIVPKNVYKRNKNWKKDYSI